MKFNKVFTAITILVGIITYLYVFFFTPLEVNQGIVQKIMYIHVPSILTAYLALTLLFFTAWGVLLTRKEIYKNLSIASSELAVLFLAVALISGSIWGRPTWNTYWTWDARLTLTLITFIYFCGYLIYMALAKEGKSKNKGAAILAIVGFFAVPLNHLAVNWFNSLHQTTTVFRASPLIDNELLYPLILAGIFFILLFITLIGWRLYLIDLKTKFYLNKNKRK